LAAVTVVSARDFTASPKTNPAQRCDVRMIKKLEVARSSGSIG
jgi:hypothetical protein